MNDVVFTKRVIMIYLGIILTLLVGVFSWYAFSNIKYVGEIKVEGNLYFSEEEIIELSGIEDNDWFLFIRGGLIERKLVKLNAIKDIRVSKSLPNMITIQIEPYQVVGCSLEDDAKVIFENNGHMVVDGLMNDFCLNKPLFHNFDDVLFEQFQDEFYNEYQKLTPGIESLISEIIFEPNDVYEYRFIVLMSDGNIVKLPLFKYINNEKNSFSMMMNQYLDYYYDAKLLHGDSFQGTINLEVTPLLIKPN